MPTLSSAAEGKTKKEIIRCLKRYIACEIYKALCRPQQPGWDTSAPGSGPTWLGAHAVSACTAVTWVIGVADSMRNHEQPAPGEEAEMSGQSWSRRSIPQPLGRKIRLFPSGSLAARPR
jgi:hypothetical protein